MGRERLEGGGLGRLGIGGRQVEGWRAGGLEGPLQVVLATFVCWRQVTTEQIHQKEGLCQPPWGLMSS